MKAEKSIARWIDIPLNHCDQDLQSRIKYETEIMTDFKINKGEQNLFYTP